EVHAHRHRSQRAEIALVRPARLEPDAEAGAVPGGHDGTDAVAEVPDPVVPVGERDQAGRPTGPLTQLVPELAVQDAMRVVQRREEVGKVDDPELRHPAGEVAGREVAEGEPSGLDLVEQLARLATGVEAVA